MAERPFHENVAGAARRGAHGFDIVLRRHPFMTFLVAADAILQRIAARRNGCGDAVYHSGDAEPALQADGLPDLV